MWTLGYQSMPVSDQHGIQREADKWARLWQCGSPYEGVELLDTCCKLADAFPPITIEDITRAAGTFIERKPMATGLGAHNISPRAIGRLPDRLKRLLASLPPSCEKFGRWPATLSVVLIVLLPKPNGGTRAIRLFPTSYALGLGCAASNCGRGPESVYLRAPSTSSVRRRRRGMGSSRT